MSARGDYRRLGLRKPPRPVPLARITTPHGDLTVVCGMNGKTWTVDASGRLVRDTGVIVGAGMVRDVRNGRTIVVRGTP